MNNQWLFQKKTGYFDKILAFDSADSGWRWLRYGFTKLPDRIFFIGVYIGESFSVCFCSWKASVHLMADI